MAVTDFLIRILSAVILGFIIGTERQYRRTLAGVRTNVLVCVGACLFVMYSSIAGSGDSAPYCWSSSNWCRFSWWVVLYLEKDLTSED